MAKEGNTKLSLGKIAVPGLFLLSIALIITLSIVSLTYKTVPSISSGATLEEISNYARNLVASNQGNGETYDEAATYYTNQIAKASSEQDRFNLQLDYALFLAETGDTVAGLDVLNEIDIESVPLDARYYLYSVYIAIYDQRGDTASRDEYVARIYNEGVLDYIARLDGAEDVSYTCPVETEEDGTAEETSEEEPADEVEIVEEEVPDEGENDKEEEDDGEEYVNLGEYKQ